MTYSSSEGILRHLSPIHASQPASYPLPTDREVVIGRDHSCQIVIDSNQYDRVSRNHAAIRPLDPTTTIKEWMVYDLNSANGTFINGQRLQGGQVLRGGDRITLSENGPEFIFEYRQNTSAVPSLNENTARNSVGINKVRIKSFRIERDSGRLVIHCPNPLQRPGIFLGVVWAFFAVVVTLLTTPGVLLLLVALRSRDLGGILFGGGWVLFMAPFWLGVFGLVIQAGVTAYTFDARKREFAIAAQSFLGRLFHQYQISRYPLDDLTAVRLVRSKYEGDEGTKYDSYNIYLDRVSGRSIELSGLSNKLRDDLETAQQLVEVIDEFLSASEGE